MFSFSFSFLAHPCFHFHLLSLFRFSIFLFSTLARALSLPLAHLASKFIYTWTYQLYAYIKHFDCLLISFYCSLIAVAVAIVVVWTFPFYPHRLILLYYIMVCLFVYFFNLPNAHIVCASSGLESNGFLMHMQTYVFFINMEQFFCRWCVLPFLWIGLFYERGIHCILYHGVNKGRSIRVNQNHSERKKVSEWERDWPWW